MAVTDETNPTVGFARWLVLAPPSASVREVVEAFEEFDDPRDAWPQQADLDDYRGDTR